MKKSYYILIFLICFGSFSYLFMQEYEKKDLNIQIDYAQFRGNSGASLLEINYSIPRDEISHSQIEDGFLGEYKFFCSVFYKNNLINKFEWGGKDLVKTKSEILPTQSIVDYHLLLLQPNTYKLTIEYASGSDMVLYTRENDVKIENYEEGELKISSIQYCSLISKANTDSRFVKNGYSLTLNPSAIFGSNWSTLYYYSEIYNLSNLNENSDSTYTVITSINTTNGEVIKRLPKKNNIRIGNSVVNVGQISIGDLNNGAFELELLVKDNGNHSSITRSKKFFVFKPGNLVHSSRFNELDDTKLLSTFLGFSEEELDKEFEYIRYITTTVEKDQYENLNLSGKREFLTQLWNKKNDTFGLKNKNFRDEYFKRIEFANQRYSSGQKEGWRTGPGRVILVYGKPDELDKFTSQATMNQYEIWQYHDVQGGVQFVFVDFTGYGDLRLVHSTALNEIQDYQWQQRYLHR